MAKMEILPLDIVVTPNDEGKQRIELLSRGDDPDNIYCINAQMGFPADGEFKVIGTTVYRFPEDGSHELVYLLFNAHGTLLRRATKYFKVVA